MTFFIRYTTATHKNVHGPFNTLNGARRKLKRDHNWYIARLACIVEADDVDGALHADAIECASD